MTIFPPKTAMMKISASFPHGMDASDQLNLERRHMVAGEEPCNSVWNWQGRGPRACDVTL